jgi:hypothetical protein
MSSARAVPGWIAKATTTIAARALFLSPNFIGFSPLVLPETKDSLAADRLLRRCFRAGRSAARALGTPTTDAKLAAEVRRRRLINFISIPHAKGPLGPVLFTRRLR